MQLDIRTGEEETRLTVTLKDGYLPVVGDHRIDSSAADPDSRVHIEPAIWFKVLVLDSVVIDCPKRAIMWNSDPNTALGSELKRSPGKSTRASKGADHDEESPLQKRKRISQSMYIGGEFYGFESELDELFDTMQETLKFFSEANIDSARFYETVMRMLHCHVLPAISLTEEDSARLEFILKQQETLIERVDDEVMQKEKQTEEIKQAAKRLRLRFIEELSKNDPPAAEDYQGEFASLLEKDIKRDIDLSSDRLNELQRGVEDAKVKAMCETNSHHSSEIDLKRMERDLGFEQHQKLLHARENLRELVKEAKQNHRQRRWSLTESLRDSFRSKKTAKEAVREPLRNIYLEMHRKMGSIKQNMMELVQKKVMMISVKEAIRNTLREIGETSESLGVDTDRRGGSRATHVLRQSRIPREWLTLTEQVAVILSDPKSKIFHKHQQFTDSVISRCGAALFERHLLNLSSSSDEGAGSDSCDAGDAKVPPQTYKPHLSEAEAEKGKPDSVDKHLQLEGELGLDDVVIIHNTNEDHLKRLAETLKEEIHNHFDEIVSRFQEELKTWSRTAPKKLWLCYEAHFYDAVMADLVKVYEHACIHIGKKLCRCIPELSAEDFNLEDTVVIRALEWPSRRSHLHVQFSDATDTDCEPEHETEPVNQDEGQDDVSAEQGDEETIATNDAGSNPEELHSIEEKEELLRQLSAPTTNPTTEPAGHQVKKVRIHYPSSVTLIYNRRTWPIPSVESVAGEFDIGMDALMLGSDEAIPDEELEEMAERQTLERHTSSLAQSESQGSATLTKKMRIRRKYRALFAPALSCIHEAISDNVPLVKLQHLTRCLREVTAGITALQEQEQLTAVGVCADNLLDVLVVLLCNCSAHTVAKLHAHVTMLTDLMPPCLTNGPYQYSLIQFIAAFSVIQEQVILSSRQGGTPHTIAVALTEGLISQIDASCP